MDKLKIHGFLKIMLKDVIKCVPINPSNSKE